MVVPALGVVIILITLAIGDQFVKDMDLEHGALGGLGAIVVLLGIIAGGFMLVL